MGLMLFNVFINNLGDGTECILSKSAQHTKLGWVLNVLEGRATVQRDADRLEKWVDRNLMKFNNNKKV